MENHIHGTHNNQSQHSVTHHKLDAIKAIKSGWKHMMKSPFTYIGFTVLFLLMSFAFGILGSLPNFLDVFLSMVVIKFLLDKYEERKVNINFTFMEFVNFFVAQLILIIGFVLLFIAIALPTFYPIYQVAVTDKQSFWGEVKTLMERPDNINNNDIYNNEEVNLTQYIDITGDETAVLSLLTLFLIGFCAIIYLAFRVSVTQWFLIDKKFGPIEAIKHSWHATRNNVTQLSILAVLSTLIMIVGALALFVGLLFAIPLLYMITLDSYKQMIGESK